MEQQRHWTVALSGSGLEAVLYQLGVFERMNERGNLPFVDHISSVSAGAILAGLLASQWKNLEFQNDVVTNFENVIVRPIREFCAVDVENVATDRSLLTPNSDPGEFIEDLLNNLLYGGATMSRDSGQPEFTFVCTDLTAGQPFYLSTDSPQRGGAPMPVSGVVAACLAHPPCFPPRCLLTERGRRDLTDGAICDPLGIGPLMNSGGTLVICDGARAPATCDVDVTPDGYGQYPFALTASVTALRSRELREASSRFSDEQPVVHCLSSTANAWGIKATNDRCLRAVQGDVQVSLMRAGYTSGQTVLSKAAT